MAPTKPAKKPRRARGEGSIFQRADGLWVGSIEARDPETGNRRQKRVYAKSKLALVAKLDELKTEVADGLNLNRTMTVTQWLDYWLPNVHRERIRPTTYRDYTHVCANISKAIGHKKLFELTPADVRKMQTLIGKGERRTQKAHVILDRALKDAVAEGIIRRNVAAAIDAPEVRKNERQPLSIADSQKILTYARAHRGPMESTRWLFLFLTGTRQGESLGLTWDRVDLTRGAADISWQLQRLQRTHGCGDRTENGWPCGKNGNVGYCTNPQWNMPIKFEYTPLHASLALTRPKSQAGKRWVPIIGPLRDALVELRDSDLGPNPHNLVFHRANGSPIVPSEDNAAWHVLLREAGVIGEKESLPLHATRHTAATVLRGAGADEQTRMEILGHNSPEVTRIYAHADAAKNSTMMDALGVLLPPKGLPAAD